MFRQGQLAVHGLAILLGRNEAGISNRGKFFLHHPVFIIFAQHYSFVEVAAIAETAASLPSVRTVQRRSIRFSKDFFRIFSFMSLLDHPVTGFEDQTKEA